jgi:hypothetical protein
MAERKVLNTYYSADFDPSKMQNFKRKSHHHLKIPFNMTCSKCDQNIYFDQSFIVRRKSVTGNEYSDIQIYRLHIKCKKCFAPITILNDPENKGYQIEIGAVKSLSLV